MARRVGVYTNQPRRPHRGEGQWPEQFKRVKRLYERFRSINQGKDAEIARQYLTECGSADWWTWGTHSSLDWHFKDDIFSFFQNCFHLRDWIYNAPEFGPRPSVRRLVNRSAGLSVCADIANGLKHLRLSQPRRRARIGPSDRPAARQGQTTYAVFVTVIVDGTERDGFEIAQDCVREWEAYVERELLAELAAVDQVEADRVFGHFERNRQSSTRFT